MIYLMLSFEIIFIKTCIFGISNSFSRTKPPRVRPASQQAFNSKDHTKEAPPPYKATSALAWGRRSCAPTCPRQCVPPGHPPSTLGAGAKTHIPEKTMCPRAQPAPEVRGQPQTTVCSLFSPAAPRKQPGSENSGSQPSGHLVSPPGEGHRPLVPLSQAVMTCRAEVPPLSKGHSCQVLREGPSSNTHPRNPFFSKHMQSRPRRCLCRSWVSLQTSVLGNVSAGLPACPPCRLPFVKPTAERSGPPSFRIMWRWTLPAT